MKKIELSVRALLLAIAGAGCSSSSSGEDGCNDLVSELVEWSVRCGHNGRQSQIEISAAFRCADVAELHDERSFYGSCLPSFRTFSCEQLGSETLALPESCYGQLIPKD